MRDASRPWVLFSSFRTHFYLIADVNFCPLNGYDIPRCIGCSQHHQWTIQECTAWGVDTSGRTCDVTYTNGCALFGSTVAKPRTVDYDRGRQALPRGM